MKFVMTTTYNVIRVRIKDILAGGYKQARFIEDKYDNPWPYNEDWFLTQPANKLIYVLSGCEEEAKITQK